jgi:hypothetical protein
MATPISLNNTNDNVIVSVRTADNFIQIFLSPDSSTTVASAKVYEASGFGIPTSPSATLPLNNYLISFKALNPGARSVTLTICYGNYSGSGGFSYSITGPGVSLPTVNANLSAFTSRMDAYTVNLF